MNKAYDRIIWENYPSEETPLNETNLNRMDAALDTIDDRVVNFDTTKANQTDLLQSLRSIAYNSQTGIFTFTYWNGSTFTADLNIEKIPVNFSMSNQGILTMTTADGTTYTADVASLIKIYTFNNSTDINFNTATDVSGNKTITATIADGSVTERKLQPNFLADCRSAVSDAEDAQSAAEIAQVNAKNFAEDAEAHAVGQRGGVDVPSTDPAYHNNAKYWAEKAEENTASLEVSGSYYATSTGQAANKNKTATVDVSQGFKLRIGVIVGVKFDANNTYSVTAGNPITLNVNGTGAKPIYYAATSENTGTNTTIYGRTNSINYYQYDGTYWVWISGGRDNNTTYSAMSVSELTTGTATTTRVVQSNYLKQGIEAIAGLIDTENNTTTFTSSDVTDASATSWTSVTPVASGENHASIFAKVSQMFKNVRYLAKILGTTDISAIGDGTVTGAVNALNSNLEKFKIVRVISGAEISSPTPLISLIPDLILDIAVYKITISRRAFLLGANATSIYLIRTNTQTITDRVILFEGSEDIIAKLNSTYQLESKTYDYEIRITAELY